MPYPDELETLRRLVKKGHTKIKDEPLLFAIYYASQLVPDEECLFEVAVNFGLNQISRNCEFFQIQFNPSGELPLQPGHRLRLLLTSEVEMKAAFAHEWPQLEDLKRSIADKQFELLHSDKRHPYTRIFLSDLGLREKSGDDE